LYYPVLHTGVSIRHDDVKQVRLEKLKATALLILQVALQVMMADFKKGDDPMDKDTRPKNFFEAIIRPDGRSSWKLLRRK
jgi:hypothetical protein